MDDFAELMPGRKDARFRMSGAIEISDPGGTCPLYLSASLQAGGGFSLTSLQESIQDWHGQAQVHALQFAPEILCIQINRFTCGDGVPG